MSQAPRVLPVSSSRPRDPLADPELRRAVERFVRRRVPSADVDDVVQTVFLDALAARDRPMEPTELARWLLGIARHKVVDRHRRATRESPGPAELPEIPAPPGPFEARSLADWAARQAGVEKDAQRTLDWMVQEGDGEKLDAIASSEQIPAARVRQRVSRMRRWMKARWAAELAAAAVCAGLAIIAWWILAHPSAPPEAHDVPTVILPEIAPPPAVVERAQRLREDGLRACDAAEWRSCLDALDAARTLDPDGEQDPKVGAARRRADDALAPPPLPISKVAPSAAPRAVAPKGPSKAKSDAPDVADLTSADFTISKDAPTKSRSAPSEGSRRAVKPVQERAASTVLGAGWAK